MKKIIHYYFCGLAMGAADIVPGISGGTIAFILGVYYKLLVAIQSFNLQFVRLFLSGKRHAALELIPWAFLLPLGAGIACSIFSLAKVVTYLLNNYPTPTWLFFFGLVFASFFIVARTTPFKGLSNILPFLAGLAFAWCLIGLNPVPVEPTLPIYFVSAFVAICALLLPGLSGATILMLLGIYPHVLNAVATFNLPVLIVFASGCVCGALTFARVVSAVLTRFPIGGTSLMLGLMLGSLRAVWPWKTDNGYPALPQTFDATLIPALLCCLLGVVVPIALHVVSKRVQGAGIRGQ